MVVEKSWNCLLDSMQAHLLNYKVCMMLLIFSQQTVDVEKLASEMNLLYVLGQKISGIMVCRELGVHNSFGTDFFCG